METREKFIEENLENTEDEYITWACLHEFHGACKGAICDCNCHPHDGQPPYSSEQIINDEI